MTPGMLKDLNEEGTRLSEVTKSSSTQTVERAAAPSAKGKGRPAAAAPSPDPERWSVPVGSAGGEVPAMAPPAADPEKKKKRERKK